MVRKNREKLCEKVHDYKGVPDLVTICFLGTEIGIIAVFFIKKCDFLMIAYNIENFNMKEPVSVWCIWNHW
jgi:hypothetical protein